MLRLKNILEEEIKILFMKSNIDFYPIVPSFTQLEKNWPA